MKCIARLLINKTQSPSPLTCGNPSDSVFFFLLILAGTDNFYTTVINAVSGVTSAIATDGYVFGGVGARVFITQELSTVPLYRAYQGAGVDHFYTTSVAELDFADTSMRASRRTYTRHKSVEASSSIASITAPPRNTWPVVVGRTKGLRDFFLDISPCA
ncbi:hypothetical protein B0H19DRAFT_1172665 [Mycena capillaripes]|nr:hypothetical protein B0H19DRAFT_1172665 [Mycena capillaripes]